MAWEGYVGLGVVSGYPFLRARIAHTACFFRSKSAGTAPGPNKISAFLPNVLLRSRSTRLVAAKIGVALPRKALELLQVRTYYIAHVHGFSKGKILFLLI